ncbi:MAG TPA: autotransporter-associated beta strand repeat-containing protein, partial [Tepidisphaeraceae bacterium]|nr:autotransporter-associated beta strand repeat-containing protein [Tepidisphaeraceae bacterium]
MQKQNRTPGRPVALTAAVIAVMTGSSAWAQSTWTGSATDVWSDPLRWSAGVPNAVDAIANIDGTTTGKVMTDGVFTVGTLNLTRAVNIETSPTAFDPARGLTLSTSTGSPTIHVNGGDVFYYAGLFGTQGFTKTGNNKLTFRFNALNQTYSGDIRINAGILGINQNGSLGDDNNDLFIANGARLLAEPGSNSGLITLPSTRTITLAGAQSQLGSNNAAVNLVINGNIVEDAAGRGLVKTDAGVVTLAGTISYTGETRIAGGTLALSGSALLPSGQNLRFNQPAAATLDVGSTHQTVRTIVMDNTTANRTITGAAGSLTVNGPANLELRGNNGITYDFSGLGEFTYNRSTSNFVVQPVNVAAVTNIFDLNLAKSGSGGGTNTITAAQITIGGGVSDGNNGNTARVHLGTVNTFNADTISLGGFNAGAVVDFQSGLTSPSLKIRGTNGTSSAATVKIGETSSGTRRGEGVLNLTGGTID